jgi:predicted XRE-type DNA-binding protein
MPKKIKKYDIEKSSGNIFKDLGFKEPKEALAKAQVARKINQIIDSKKYTQIQAAEILKVDQPKISALKNGRLNGFSLERLFSFLNALNHRVEIRIVEIRPHTSIQHIDVVCAGN